MLKFPSPHDKVLPANIQCISPPFNHVNAKILDRFKGALVGLAVGDALRSGNIKDLQAVWWTGNTSMALCLASSLITKQNFNPYDQLVRYNWSYKYGYLSLTERCVDIDNATRDSLEEFSRQQTELKNFYGHYLDKHIDNLSYDEILHKAGFDVNCSRQGVNGNGALVRLAPVALFFYRTPSLAVEFSGLSARLTHGDNKTIDACRYYGALLVAALRGVQKEKKILSPHFYNDHRDWFDWKDLHRDVRSVALGSYKRLNGHKGGIQSTSDLAQVLEAALRAFWIDDGHFQQGALNVMNLGGDTHTVAAIYGQLAGAYHGYDRIPTQWVNQLYANKLIMCTTEWLYFLTHHSTLAHQQQMRTLPSSQRQQPCPVPSVKHQQSYPSLTANPVQYHYSTSVITSSRTLPLLNMPSRVPTTIIRKDFNRQKSTNSHASPWEWFRLTNN